MSYVYARGQMDMPHTNEITATLQDYWTYVRSCEGMEGSHGGLLAQCTKYTIISSNPCNSWKLYQRRYQGWNVDRLEHIQGLIHVVQAKD